MSCPRFFIILHVNLENKLYYPLMTVNLFSYAQFDFIHSNVLGPSPVSTMKTHSILLFLWMTLILVIHEFILWIINMKFMIFIKFLLNWLITHFSNSVKIFHSIIAMKYIEIDLLISSMFIGPCLITLVLIHPSKMVEPSLSISKALIMFMLCSSGANRP